MGPVYQSVYRERLCNAHLLPSKWYFLFASWFCRRVTVPPILVRPKCLFNNCWDSCICQNWAQCSLGYLGEQDRRPAFFEFIIQSRARVLKVWSWDLWDGVVPEALLRGLCGRNYFPTTFSLSFSVSVQWRFSGPTWHIALQRSTGFQLSSVKTAIKEICRHIKHWYSHSLTLFWKTDFFIFTLICSDFTIGIF